MTTTIDPAGSPSVVYNREGTTIAAISGAGTTQNTATPIVRHSGWTVVLVTSTIVDAFGNPSGVSLPANAEIGDLVEVHYVPGESGSAGSIFVFPESGAQIENLGTNALAQVIRGLFRKTAASQWYCIVKEYP